MCRIRAISWLLAAATAVWAQDGQLSVSDAAWQGLEIRFATKIEPSGTPLYGGVTVEQGRAQHIINDDLHKRYFGYDLQLDPNEDGKEARLRIEPLRSMRIGFGSRAGWTKLDLPKYPVIPNVKVGETVALDLLVNPATGQKIVDYLTLRRSGEIDFRTRARDFALSDVEIMLDQPQVWVNGKSEATERPGGVSGAVVWFYLTGHGRFILSLLPNETLGFKKNGVISAESVLFRSGSTEYRVVCNSRVAPGAGPFNLYVVHEADWRPQVSEAFTFGSADKAEWVVGKH